jgi:hypothetical protein
MASVVPVFGGEEFSTPNEREVIELQGAITVDEVLHAPELLVAAPDAVPEVQEQQPAIGVLEQPVTNVQEQQPATDVQEQPPADSAAPFVPSYYGLQALQIPRSETINDAAAIADEDVDHLSHVGRHLSRTFHTAAIRELTTIARRKQPATHDVKYWHGAPQPFRDGTDHSPITDPAVIAREEQRILDAENEDKEAAAAYCSHADRLHGFGIQIDFLLFLTWELSLWDWKTSEVVQFLVKPATEKHGRCRFAELPLVRRFMGPATVFASHCWGGKWGDLVAAVCAGADARRVVWIDVFAVRQWPGNGADLDVRGVIARCRAAVVAVAPVEGKLATEDSMMSQSDQEIFMASAEYTEGAAKKLPFFRLWCLAEIFAVMQASKGLVFRGVTMAAVDWQDRQVLLAGNTPPEKEKIMRALQNCSRMVNFETAECAVAADHERETAAVLEATAGVGGIARANRIVAAAIATGGVSVGYGVAAVDNFVCGETEALQMLPANTLQAAEFAACAAGQLEVLEELLSGCGDGSGASQARAAAARRVVTEGFYPLYLAASNGQEAVVKKLLGVEGVDVNRGHPTNGVTPLWEACHKGHEGVVRLLLAHAATEVNQARTDVGSTPLFIACQEGHESVARMLLEVGHADVNKVNAKNRTPINVAAFKGRLAVVRLLLKKSANTRIKDTWGDSPLASAKAKGHSEVAALLAGTAD